MATAEITTRDSSATVTSSMTSSADADTCRLFDVVVCTALIGSFCVFGLAGNVTSFAVFCRQHKSGAAASAILLLQCMAVCDSLLLIVALAVYAVPAAYSYSEHGAIYETFDYIVYVWPPSMVFHTVTVWLTVLVSVNRFNAVCRAVEEFGTTTLLRRTRLQVVVVVTLSVVYNVPRFFEHQMIYSGEQTATAVNTTVSDVNIDQPMMLGDSQLYQIIYSNILYYPVMYVVPLGTLAFLNVRLIAALNALKRRTLSTRTATSSVEPRQSQTRRRRRKDDNITLCIVVIVCVFIVCQTPALLNQIFWALFEPAERDCGRFHYYYTKLSDLLVVVNSSCNFVVYCLFGATFRRIFVSTVCCCCCCCDTTSSQRQDQDASETRVRLQAPTTVKCTTLQVCAVTEANQTSLNQDRF